MTRVSNSLDPRSSEAFCNENLSLAYTASCVAYKIRDGYEIKEVEEALAREKPVLFTGHSIGGAVATLAMLSVLEKL
ncbi:hypothetical protein KI387_013596, partial [Taxus chinensis]